MKGRRRYIKYSGLFFLVIATLLVGLALFMPRLVDVNAYRDEILSALRASLHRQVTFKRGEFAWDFGPSFVFDSVTVKEPDGTLDFIAAERITIRIALFPLLQKKLVFRELGLEGATIRVERGADGTLTIDDLLKPGTDGYQVHFGTVHARRCTLRWSDKAVKPAPLSADISDINLTLDHVERGRKGHIKLNCQLPRRTAASGKVAVNADLWLPADSHPLTESRVDGTIELKQCAVGIFWPYFGSRIPFPDTGGTLDLATSLKGRLTEFTAKGKVRMAGASLVWPTVFHYTLAPGSVQLDYDLRLTPSLISIPHVDFSADGFRIRGSFQMHDYRSKDPRIVARASTPGTFRYEDVRTFVPYGIIEKDASDYIEHKIRAGVFKLDSGILDGKISQIAHMEIGDNCNTLYIKGPVEKAVLSYGPRAPEFRNIKGHIELKGKNFNLIGMSGTFGSSPFRMNGSITEYNTDKQSDYPVRMEISPNPPEVAWLARLAGARKLEYSGASALVLSGSGHHSAYRLDGDWELKNAAYNYPGALRKPAGQDNHIVFSSVIGHGETRLTSMAYSLATLKLSATATLRYGDLPYLGFELHTNTFGMGEQLQLLPVWQQYRPRGRAQASIRGSGNPEDFSAMDYSGTITLGGFSLQPDERLRQLTGINGTITFKGNSLESSSINAQYGTSPLTLKGVVRSLKNGEAELRVTSPTIFLRDLNLAPASSPLAIRRMNASLAAGDGGLTVRSLSGQLNNSNFSMSGTYSGGRAPEADLSVTSSSLDIADLALLTQPAGAPGEQKGAATPSNLKLTLKLAVDSGIYGKLAFGKLNATLLRDSGIFHLQGLDTVLYGGKLTAKGRIAPGGTPENRYDLGISLERINAEKFFGALGITREVTGTLNLQGDITARGTTMADIKRTALGNIRIRLEKGKLRRFSTLSKVFSILNISQLLKGQLPDMAAGGMPYNEIRGNLAVKDGSAATQDLYIASDAINISVIGSADLIREELDFKIGVQPLQTVDKIVNRIPVVGWILTGKDKDFVTLYFEAKGKWADPKVSAVPVSTMGKGILNIFRRAFELPVRLFTDTGEVILGK